MTMNEQFEIFKNSVRGKNVAVLGLGISNLPALEFLYKCGAQITVFDKNPECDESKKKHIDAYCKDAILGENYLDNISGFDIILKSPGIPPYAGNIQKAVDEGAVLTSEMELFLTLCPCKVIGVTGSDGKTTTTTLIYEMLKAEGKNVFVGGNIGTPLLDKVEFMTDRDFVVLELSSFQLQTMKISPDISVITNLSPNHLDYHKGGMEEYIQAKTNIFEFQSQKGKLVLNADNDVTNSLSGRENGLRMMFSRQFEIQDGAYCKDGKIYCMGEYVMDTSDIKIKGLHNVENYLAAICAVWNLVSLDSIIAVARNFGGVKHRMQFVRCVDDVDFYNDSIGSSPSRTIAGLKAHEGRIVLIAGGYDKKIPFDTLGEAVNEHVYALVLCGATSNKIKSAVVNASKDGKTVPIFETQDFESAVKTAFAVAKSAPKGVDRVSVILSPACASFDMFKNFELRGEAFIDIVKKL